MFAEEMTTDELISVVRAMDAAGRTMDRRFEGDDSALNDLMDRLNLPCTLAEKLIVTGAVLRECVARGLLIPCDN